jgi:hypothetical protein
LYYSISSSYYFCQPFPPYGLKEVVSKIYRRLIFVSDSIVSFERFPGVGIAAPHVFSPFALLMQRILCELTANYRRHYYLFQTKHWNWVDWSAQWVHYVECAAHSCVQMIFPWVST